MKRATATIAGCVLLLGLLAGSAGAQPFIYPQKGQTPQQQSQDQGECTTWATQQTGFNPLSAPRATAPMPQGGNESVGGGAVRGAAGGALGGALIGAIAGDAGKGAAIGAAGGGLFGGARTRNQNRQAQQQQEQWAQQQAAQQQQGRANFNRAFSACMEGRGYQVR